MDAVARRLAAPIFALALFASAALTFLLQPMVGRLLTPMLGGSPSVWNTSMAFFQAALLLGYLYAHALAKLSDLRVQAAIHGLVLALAWLTLPIHVSGAFGPPNDTHPAFWLLGVLTLSAGAPFAAASATAPLLQAWFARTGRADASDPYYLYAASNLGSFAGLLAYPILVEQNFGLHAQAALWAAGFVLVAAFVLTCAAAAIAAHGTAPKLEAGVAPTWRQRLYWIAAAAIPSSLILGVTQHISTDIASAPFLWVAPLALYLLTFVIAFARGGERVTPWALVLQPILVAGLIFFYFNRGDSPWRFLSNIMWPVGANLAGFFVSALVCHLALARARPQAGRLTDFYLCLSLGGVLGGALTALVAPVVFNDIYEYPLMLAAAALFRPRAAVRFFSLSNAFVASAIVLAIAALVLLYRPPVDVALSFGALGGAAALMGAALPIYTARTQTMQLGFLITSLVLAVTMIAVLFLPDFLLTHKTIEGRAEAEIHQPIGIAISALAFLVIAFCAQAALHQRAEHPMATEYSLGVAMACLTLVMTLLYLQEKFSENGVIHLGLAFATVAMVFNRDRPIVFAGLILAGFVIIFADDHNGGLVVSQQRSFFGVLRTEQFTDPANRNVPTLRILMHGTTIHGAQLSGVGDVSRRPLTYYNPNTALGEATLAGLSGGEQSSLALIGMGTGTTACLMRPQDHLTVFEIDRNVVRLSAEPGGLFTYIPECQPHARIVLGDARLSIAREPPKSFDVIVVDAFSSDAIPAHLLTKEAIALYLSKTTDRGIVVLHLSNRNLALVSESVRVAHALNMPFLWRVSPRVDDAIAGPYGGLPASVMILARNADTLAHLPLASRDWRVLPTPPGRAWSDDYINLPRALLQGLNGDEDCLQNEARLKCKN